MFSLYYTSFAPALTISSITWEEYLQDCSAENIIKSKSDVQSLFEHKYAGQIIQWEGYLMKANVNQGWLRREHAAIILVKMQPSESEIYADLVLTLDESDLEKNREEIVKLNRGEKFVFNATLIKVADEESIHHLHGLQLIKIEGFIDIPSHMNNGYRNSAFQPSVEIVSVIDRPKALDHDHVHYYNETFNSTLE